jgi:HPt (histidine-containing phosphotransfer) domain-containing protein
MDSMVPQSASGEFAGAEPTPDLAINSVLDPEALQALHEEVGEHSTEFFIELIDSYLQDSPELLQAIQTAVMQDSAIALKRAAHTLKSSSATLGATTVAELCKRLEIISHQGITRGTDTIVSQLLNEYEAVKAALQLKQQQL